MRTQSGRRGLAGMVTLLLVGSGAAVASASPAHAQLSSPVVCTGTVTTTLSPGLTNDPQMITTVSDYHYNSCLPPLLSPVSHGSARIVVEAEFSCQQVPTSVDGSKTITWNTGQPSTFEFTALFTTVFAEGQAVSEGHISDGTFAEAPAIETLTAPTLQIGNCSNGITQRQSLVTLTIGDLG